MQNRFIIDLVCQIFFVFSILFRNILYKHINVNTDCNFGDCLCGVYILLRISKTYRLLDSFQFYLAKEVTALYELQLLC